MSQDLIELFGEAWVLDQILAERTLVDICNEMGTNPMSFFRWQNAEPGRLERVNDTRRQAAQLWEERAATVIAEAKSGFELQKARELAHHYRWRASRIAPRQYGDKVQQEITGAGGAPLVDVGAGVLEALARKHRDPDG